MRVTKTEVKHASFKSAAYYMFTKMLVGLCEKYGCSNSMFLPALLANASAFSGLQLQNKVRRRFNRC